tara:strand:+ start:1309 stop:1428 length:120 start_codon:yes stop_codon:yes gene_type:complete
MIWQAVNRGRIRQTPFDEDNKQEADRRQRATVQVRGLQA